MTAWITVADRRDLCQFSLMRKGFSLVELMVTVAIVGILASIAVPTFQDMQLKAKLAEVEPVLDAIATASIAYYSAHDDFVTAGYGTCTANPTGALDKEARPWIAALDPCWSAVGYITDGAVRCHYNLQGFGSGSNQYERARAQCDVDDDNAYTWYNYYIATATRDGYSTRTNPLNY